MKFTNYLISSVVLILTITACSSPRKPLPDFELCSDQFPFFLSDCSGPQKPLPEVDQEFEKVLEAHGDWGQWIQAKAMSFTMIHETNLTQETHFINLDSRKIRIDANNFQMGFDGQKTWISPNRESFGGQSVRFYHNLYFYFYAIPYVFTDPGITVKKVESRTLNGKSYPTFQVTFESDKGDSPDDEYYMLINEETNRLEYLLYTVTYFGNASPSLNALKYEDYRNAEGLYFPRIITGYNLEGDNTTNVRIQVSFADILLLKDEFEELIFEKPEIGVYSD